MEELIDEILNKTGSKLSKLEESFYRTVLNHFVDKLDIGEGSKIKFNTTSISAINSLSEKLGGLDKSLISLGEDIQNNVGKIADASLRDFAKYDTKDSGFQEVVKKSITDKANSSINSNLSLERSFAELKQRSMALMSRPEGITLSDLRKMLKTEAFDKKIATRYFAAWTQDVYYQYQRSTSNEMRKKLGFRFAIYQGGLIDTSRAFCDERNGNVYHEDEINSWDDLEFDGKLQVGHKCLLDCGGYRCRHRWGWVSDEVAFAMRPELEIKYGKKAEAKVVEIEVPKPAEAYKNVKYIKDEFSQEEQNKYLKLAGVPEDFKGGVIVRKLPTSGSILISAKSDLIEMYRYIDLDKSTIANEEFKIPKDSIYKGQGSNIFKNQVNEAIENGFKKLVTYASRDGDYNGYYTWARLGYRPRISEKIEVDELNKKAGTNFKSWDEIVNTQQGLAAWKQYGRSFDGVFGLTPGSKSLEVLNNYINSKNKVEKLLNKKLVAADYEATIDPERSSIYKVSSTFDESKFDADFVVEAKTLRAYTQQAYYVNKKIINGESLDIYDKKYIDNLDNSLEKLPIEKTQNLYRYINMSAKEFIKINNIKEGELLNFKSYTSTTTSKSSAVDDPNSSIDKSVVLIVESHRSGRNIANFSVSKGENEILFPRNTNWKIRKIDNNKIYIYEQ